MTRVVLLLFLIVSVDLNAQRLNCKERLIEHVKAVVFVDGTEQMNVVSAPGRGNVVLKLNDTSFKVVGFELMLPCGSGYVNFDLIRIYFQGDRVKPTDLYYDAIFLHDYVLFQCIIIEKKGVRFRVADLKFAFSDYSNLQEEKI